MKSCKLHLRLVYFAVVCVVLSACAQAVSPTPTVAPPPAAPTTAPVAAPTTAPVAAPTAVPATKAPAPTEAPVTLTIYHNWGKDDAKGAPMAAIFAGFQAQYPNIKLDTQIYVDSDIPKKVETEFVAGKEPDIVFSNFDPLLNNWVDSGLAIPASKTMAQFGLDKRIIQMGIDSWMSDKGQLIAIPLEGSVQGLLYNTQILDAAKVSLPKTTDELLAAIPKIKAAGYEVFAASPKDDGGKRAWRLPWQGAMTPEEAKTFAKQGKLASYPNAVIGMNDFFRLKDAGAFPADVAGLSAELEHTLFYTGKAAFWTGGSYYWQEMMDRSPDMVKYIKIGGFPIPQGSKYAKPLMVVGLTAKGVVVTRNGAKKMDAVEKFVRYLYQPENIAKFVEAAGMLPPVNDVKYDPAKVKPLFIQAFDLANSSDVSLVYNPALPAGVSYNPAISFAYTKGATAADTIKMLDKAFTDIGIK
jgi:multiple sugar transport system substrate-binding protein